jgi:hypothetical protein
MSSSALFASFGVEPITLLLAFCANEFIEVPLSPFVPNKRSSFAIVALALSIST